MIATPSPLRRARRAAARTGRSSLALIALAAAAACRLQEHAMDIEVHDAWVRAAPAGANSAAYLRFENETAGEVTVDSILTDVARAAELHETRLHEGMAHMAPAGPLVVAAGRTVYLRPGARHLMLLDVQRELRVGDRVRLVLVFSGGRRLAVDAEVRDR